MNRSQKPLTEKIAEISGIVMETKERVTLTASSCAGEINTHIRDVLAAQGVDTSPQAYATEIGAGSVGAMPTDIEELKAEIGKQLDQLESAASTDLPHGTLSGISSSEGAPVKSPATIDQGAAPPQPVATDSPPSNGAVINQGATGPARIDETAAPPRPATGGQATPVTPTTNLGGTRIGGVPSLTTPTSSAPSANPSIDAPAPSTAPATANPAAPQAPTTLSPHDLVENFNAGNQTGAPISTGAEAITTAATSPVHTTPQPLSTPLADTAAPATPVFETAHAIAPDVTQIHTSPTEFSQPVVAPTPAAAIAPTLMPPSAGPVVMPPPTPPSSLLAYGADLRAPATPAAPSIIPATAPGSAPVNPAGGSAPTGQPALVRQPTAPTTQSTAAAGLTERAFAATASGAAAGALSARAAAESRLQRLLAAVARQQPKLRWAIGDLENGSTVLVTDLAGGWIPPDIEIPTGITLLPPADRRGDLTTLLPNTTLIADYQPGQPLATVQSAEPPNTSIRARDTAAVEDLGWKLSQATKWRDGLPRLAHTLAKAVSARTGCLDSEVDLLRDYLATVARTVIARYPRAVNPTQVGNWQLLATIDALINDEKTIANYHFAWFQAHALTREGYR